jgi:exonuclease III
MNFKIFNLNCWLLPPPLSTDNNKRLSQIISLIKNTQPNIISLQEVWLNKYVKRFQNELKNYSFITCKNSLYNKSGLVTGLLKNQSFKKQFFPITSQHNLIERIAQKGFHEIKLSKNISFINTHLYAPINTKEKIITKSQLSLLQKLIKSKKYILSGDLNLNNKELSLETKKFKPIKKFKNIYKNPYQKMNFNKKFNYDNSDYILKTSTIKIPIKIKYLRSPLLSDHLVLIGKITI